MTKTTDPTTTEQQPTTEGPNPCSEVCRAQEEGYYAEAAPAITASVTGVGAAPAITATAPPHSSARSSQSAGGDGSCCTSQPSTTAEPPADCDVLCDGTSAMATTGCCYCLGAGAGSYVDCAGHQVCRACGPGLACEPCTTYACDEEECCTA